jgi:hypothetical protein
MASAKDIRVAPISRKDARSLIARIHYSGKNTMNSQLHFGVFLGGRLEGAMSFGPSMDKRKTQALVSGTKWNDFLELNRMAFSEKLPRNSESRALAVAFRLIKQHYPHIEWVISFADATQCGDGTIYRAAGFVLTGINKNKQIYIGPNGDRIIKKTMDNPNNMKGGSTPMKHFKAQGYRAMEGNQIRYVYFLNKEARCRLTVDELPYSALDDKNARMYKGKKISVASGR